MERRSSKSFFRQAISLVTMVAMAGIGSLAMAQGPVDNPDQAQQQVLAPQQLDNLVAPIALYPDPLLGQVLVAATYPVELVEAQQWQQANSGLQGQQLIDAAKQQSWDASVQALVAMPDVLAKLTQDIRWTTDLGNAFLAQQADVMSAVQRMRARAQSNGKLQTTPQETVTTESQGGQTVIEIQPANPEIIYVPTYDPMYVWGAPSWGYYPALYYPSYGFYWGSGFNISLCFGGWGGWGYGGWGWGWGPNWFGHTVFVNNYFFNRYGYHYAGGFNGGFRGRTDWGHDPGHRLGAGYGNSRLNARYGEASRASRIQAGRSGNYHSFGQGGIGNNGNGFRNGAVGGQTRGNVQGGNVQGNRGNFQGGRDNVQGNRGNVQGGNRDNGAGGYQRFQQGRQSYQAPQQRNVNPSVQQQQRNVNPGVQQQQRYNSPAMQQRYNNAPAQQQQRYSAPQMQQRYNAPAAQPRYNAPAVQQRSAPAAQPHYSAPSAPRSFGGGGGGGGNRSFGSSGGSRSIGGGGGGASHGGGGGHGGRR